MNLFDPNLKITDDEGRDITDQVHKRMLDGTYQRELAAAERQLEVAQMMGVQRYNRKLGMMPLMNIDPVVYWHWVAREGFDCWGDEGFRKDLMRDNPTLKARVEMPQDRVSFSGLEARFGKVPILQGKPQSADDRRTLTRTPNKRGTPLIVPATRYTRISA